MKRPEFIESLEAKAIWDSTLGKDMRQSVAVNVLELIRYVKVLEKAVDNSSSTFTTAQGPAMTPTRALIEAAEAILADKERDLSLYASLKKAIASAKAAEEEAEKKKVPAHAFELWIRVGANEADYVAEALSEIRDTINRSGIAGGCAGGWRGAWSVDVRKRDVTPDDYRDELEQWRKNRETNSVIEVREK